jgi:hypothetical protein
MLPSALSQAEVDKLARLFDEDLHTMLDLLSRPDPLPPHHVRAIASGILRKWFIDAWISKLARATGVTVTFPVLDNSAAVQSINSSDTIDFFVTGGVRLNGKFTWGIYASSEPFSGRPSIDLTKPSYIDLKHAKFLAQPRVFFGGQWFSTGDIIKFVSNKGGGIHIDLDPRDPKHGALEEANNFLKLGNPHYSDKHEMIDRGSDESEELLIVLPQEEGFEWTSCDVELLSAAQSLINMRVDGEPYLPLTPEDLVDPPSERQVILPKKEEP